ncbi:MAG: tellurite resistance TerB family protein [Pseudomonadaceae bacterium]|nr:tellurite resistance TerB family protein [Pseudomonadaceae bacterium]
MPLDKLLGSVTNSPAITGALSGAAGGALVTAFTNKKSAKKLLKAGGLVAVGGLAYKAYQSYKSSQQSNPAGAAAHALEAQTLPELTRQDFADVVDAKHGASTTGIIIQAMIAAAHADGHLSEDEQRRIWQQAVELSLPSSELAALSEQLSNPLDPAQLAALAPNMQTRIEIYTASEIVIDEHCEAGKSYLANLASQLQLPAQLVEALHLQSSQSPVAA